MFQTVSIGAVIVAVAGWAIYTQTDLIRPAPVVEAADGPIVVAGEDTDSDEEASEASVDEAPEEAPETDNAAEETTVSEDSDGGTTEQVDASASEDQSAEEEEAAPVVLPPAFDVVRVESDGMTVIAGTGPAGWMISILVDGVVVETVEADASGQFVAILDIGESENARVVTLSAKNADQILLSEAQVIIAPVVRQIAAVEDAPVESPAVEEAPTESPVEADAPAENEVAETTEATSASDTASEPQTESVAETEGEVVEETVTAESTTSAPTEDPADVAEDTTEATDDNVTAVQSADTEAAPTSTESESETQVASETSPTPSETSVVDDSTPEETTTETTEASTTTDEDVSATQEEPASATSDEPVAVEVVEDSSPAVLLVEGDDVQVLQPASESPVVMDQLSISAISYSEDGAVQLSGISPAGFLRVYLNNVPIVELIVPEPGEWNAELVDVTPGVYTLRIDQIGENGDVLQRVETPFKREEPAKVIEAAQTRRPLVSVEVVQPGSTLWAISRENYGSGVLFVRIFEANKDQIRNPDLIYPGQIFDLPAPPGAKKKKRTSGQ